VVEAGITLGTCGAIVTVSTEAAEWQATGSRSQAWRAIGAALLALAGAAAAFQTAQLNNYGWWPFIVSLATAALCGLLILKRPEILRGYPERFPCPKCQSPATLTSGGAAGSRSARSLAYECKAHGVFRVDVRTLSEIVDPRA
jgi:hypothetical protein